MLTPCQEMAISEGHEAVDKALFTTERRAEKFIPLLCDNCPAESKQACARAAENVISAEGVIKPTGTFGGVFYNG